MIPNHSEHTLRADKHVACTVPMATSVKDCKGIVDLCRETGLNYMMMETVVYTREFLFMKELYDQGELGKLQFLKASHQQDMDGWPGLPPMHYAPHCAGPVLGLARNEAEYVSCFPLVVHTAKKPEPEIPERVACPDYRHLLPDEIAPFTQGGVYGGEEHLSFTLGAGHGDSHPHLVHPFIELLRGTGEGYPNAIQSANSRSVEFWRTRVR